MKHAALCSTFPRSTVPSIIVALVLAGASQAAVIQVPGDYAQIHDAVQAGAAGDTVMVAAGTFTDCTHPTEGVGSTPACVIMKSGVTLIGAGPEATIVDAQGLGRGIFAEFVSDCRIENLQVRGAFADIYGAGILIRNVPSTVEVTDVKVTLCTDGGVICINSAHPVMTRLEVVGNAAKQGGGISIEESSSPQILDSIVSDNSAPSGAGIFVRTNCAPVIDGCTIDSNTITANFGNGGGIAVQAATPTITNCDITNNSTLGYGGGVAFIQGATGLLVDSRITGNDAAGDNSLGGGVACSQSNPLLSNLVISGNTCSGFFAEGGGIDISFTPAPTVENCTIVGNATSGSGFGGGISVQFGAAPNITRCIIAGATAGQGLYCLSATPNVGCTDIWGNAGGDALCGTDAGGNFSLDPDFCGTTGNLYGLPATSPCAPGNHPGGLCSGALIGALPAGECYVSGVLPRTETSLLTTGNTPNPFNPATTIWFEQDEAGPVRLEIFDLRGHQIAAHEWKQAVAGRTSFVWRGRDGDGRNLPSGIYLYRVETPRVSSTRRMSLIR